MCRTDLHVVDGDLAAPAIPVIPGHEIVGSVELLGSEVRTFAVGTRVGVPWLGGSCGVCEFCHPIRSRTPTGHSAVSGRGASRALPFSSLDHRP
jgi:D-arabinose 1-dehydrogenase-like Zn-dependent alcohol dehydrogenase